MEARRVSNEDPFESAEFLMRRAKSHFDRFCALEAEFFKDQPYTRRTDLNSDTGLKEVKIKIVRKPTDEMRGCVSDAIKNIRDSLDQSMAAASFSLTGKWSKNTHFPFGESAADLRDTLTQKKARIWRDIPTALFPAIMRIAPYPNSADKSALKSLSRVSGPHKHQVALTLGFSPQFIFEAVEFSLTDGSGIKAQFPEWDSTKDEGIVAVFPSEGVADLDFSIPAHVEIAHPELSGRPARDVLAGWGNRTSGIISGLKGTVDKITSKRGV